MRERMKQELEIDKLLKNAVEIGASDLHLSVGIKPRCRLNGSLTSMAYDILEPRTLQELLSPLLDALSRQIINDTGQYDMSYMIYGVARFRVNIFKQQGDYAAVFRVLNNNIPSFNSLNLPMSIYNLHTKQRGLILICGPTGSGKSTTLASFLGVINERLPKHIITLEDPIEYRHIPKKCIVNQREIGTDCNTFANGLRAALREDPDVILVGEMRDTETAEIALESAETGHLVCSTLHTLGAADTIDRVLTMFPSERYAQVRSMLSATLVAVVSQQLVPRVDGSGRVVTYEVMLVDKYIKELIRTGEHYKINEYLRTPEAREQGMYSMDDVILNRFTKNIISEQSALQTAFNENEMRNRIEQLKRKQVRK